MPEYSFGFFFKETIKNVQKENKCLIIFCLFKKKSVKANLFIKNILNVKKCLKKVVILQFFFFFL